jgi:molybdopterin-containing oxidoreductase family iron-sulfur binding subunit|tara:strand:- start:619 stop:1371 length:753 start_codon:yes stop_codon:yes gene_type:complete
MANLQDTLKKYTKLGYYEKFDYHWGMTIDLDRCSGCEACVVACQAENNIPTVGEKLIKEGKEIKWLRVERYWQGEYPNIKLTFLPMLCQHCDTAPCEIACPVSATYHNPDGLNTQIYNRCIGTRTCAVYCVYDARYFNWYTHTWDEPLEQQLNPEVTVRERGVMEKCTFCIQRIRSAKDTAKDEGRRLRDGDVTPACVQSCPTEAMVFGDMNDPDSRVSKMAADSRGYKVLKELNTDPSIVYLSKVESHV